MSSDSERALAQLLDNPAVWAEVPPGLKQRVLGEALGGASATEGAADGVAEPGEPDPTEAVVVPFDERPAHPRRATRERSPRWPRPAMLAAAAVVLVGITVGATLVATRGEDQPAGTEVALAGTENLPGATATVELRDEPAGVTVALDVGELPPAPDGTFYEAWLVSETRGKVSAGTFHVREPQDDIQLWLGVDPDDYDAITVTRQPLDGGTLAEGVVLLRGELP